MDIQFWFALFIGGCGIWIGSAVTVIVLRLTRTVGTLKIDHSNPDKDVYLFEIDNFERLSTSSAIRMKVEHRYDNFSQK